MDIKYEHTQKVHNFNAAKVIVPVLTKWLRPHSVIDVGCGTGTWLSVFKKHGAIEILGVDGDYVNREQLTIPESNFLPKDLEQPLQLDHTFDLVVSLEVAEHLSETVAQLFVDSLCSLSDTILFSAAITAQGGQNHINEQPPKYWIQKFEEKGYQLFDVLRPMFWEHEDVDWWYKQNMMIFTKDDAVKQKLSGLLTFEGRHIVHPVVFKNRSHEAIRFENEIERIESSKKAMSYYLDLFTKALKAKLFKK